MDLVNPEMLMIDPVRDTHILKALASDIRIKILQGLCDKPMNINELSSALDLPQSTTATNIQILEKCGLVSTKTTKGTKGSQKICSINYLQYMVNMKNGSTADKDSIQVEMPIGLFIDYNVSPPCGMCSRQQIIGYLDTPESFLEPVRVKAGLLWFEQGYVKYKFPNNAYSQGRIVKKLELSMELSSETPGTNPHWLSDISIRINNQEIGNWISPGDFGDKRGKYTPEWWKLEGSQYGILTSWEVNEKGTFVCGKQVSSVKMEDLALNDHHSIKVTIGVHENAEHVGGINIFGRGFGNYDQDIMLKLSF